MASIGAAQCIGIFICWLKRPKSARPGYHIIPVYQGAGSLEAQLRYSLARVKWNCPGGEIVVLVDMGLDGESLALYRSVISENPELYYCKADQLEKTLRRINKIQMRDNLI